MYCDPPYYIGSDSKMFKGVYPMRNIPVHHKDFPHEKLRDMLKKHKGGFILSYNDCPTIRKYYKIPENTRQRVLKSTRNYWKLIERIWQSTKRMYCRSMRKY